MTHQPPFDSETGSTATPTDPAPQLLLAHDDADRLEELSRTLQDCGDLLFAMDAETAIYQAIEHRVDLILIGSRMPDMPVLDLCTALKATPASADAAVLLMAETRDEEPAARALAAGATDLISPSCSPTLLKARVTHHIKLKRQTDLLRSLTSIDSLTGIASRHALERALTREWQRGCRTGQPIATLMVDIDHFTRYSERYGRHSADHCLMRVAAELANIVHRPADLLARYGHDEFMILLPETPLEGAARLAERACRAVHELGIPHADSGTLSVVTVSIGVAAMEPAKLGRWEQDQLIKAAESELKLAKLSGHNRAMASDLATPHTQQVSLR